MQVAPARMALEEAKVRLVQLSTAFAGESKWDAARISIDWAKQIDEMTSGLDAITRPKKNGQEATAAHDRVYRQAAHDDQYPKYYREGNRIVKVGQSRNGSTYTHRVTRPNFDRILAKTLELTRSSREFETQTLVDRCNVPKHEPQIFVRILEKQGLLLNLRRGRWRVANPDTFESSCRGVWDRIPLATTS